MIDRTYIALVRFYMLVALLVFTVMLPVVRRAGPMAEYQVQQQILGCRVLYDNPLMLPADHRKLIVVSAVVVILAVVVL